MDDQFDNDLKNHIRKVFEKVEDPSAEEGWLQLRKKFPEEEAKRRAFAWMWWAAAALLFLFLGIGVWMYSKNDQPQKSIAKNAKHAPSENLASNKSQQNTNSKTHSIHAANPAKSVADNIVAMQSTTPKIGGAANKNTQGTRVSTLLSSGGSVKKSYLAKTTPGAKKAANNSPAQQLAVTPYVNDAKTITAIPKANPVVANPPQQLAITPGVNNTTAVTIPKTTQTVGNSQAQQLATAGTTNNSTHVTDTIKHKQPAKSINDMFADNQSAKTKKLDENSGKVHFGVYAATYFNYAKGSSNNANLGAGVTAEIKIAKNLKLVTGLTVGQNSLNFNTAIPSNTQSSFAVPAASNSFSTYSLASPASVVSNAANVATVPSLKNYDANMVSLDIPLNLKYDFNPKKYDFYVIAGLSSGTFINETYTYQYNYPALFSPSLQQIQNQTSRNNFESFYFAKTLNLAFGVGYPLGKNHLILEPFLKYPLDGMGSQNIRFGAGGINLKFNFQPTKK